VGHVAYRLYERFRPAWKASAGGLIWVWHEMGALDVSYQSLAGEVRIPAAPATRGVSIVQQRTGLLGWMAAWHVALDMHERHAAEPQLCGPFGLQGWGAKSQLHLGTISGLAHSWREEEEEE